MVEHNYTHNCLKGRRILQISEHESLKTRMSWRGWGGGWRTTNTLRIIAFGAEMGKSFGTFPVEVGKKETS